MYFDSNSKISKFKKSKPTIVFENKNAIKSYLEINTSEVPSTAIAPKKAILPPMPNLRSGLNTTKNGKCLQL
jgi:hypothetical protein